MPERVLPFTVHRCKPDQPYKGHLRKMVLSGGGYYFDYESVGTYLQNAFFASADLFCTVVEVSGDD